MSGLLRRPRAGWAELRCRPVLRRRRDGERVGLARGLLAAPVVDGERVGVGARLRDRRADLPRAVRVQRRLGQVRLVVTGPGDAGGDERLRRGRLHVDADVALADGRIVRPRVALGDGDLLRRRLVRLLQARPQPLLALLAPLDEVDDRAVSIDPNQLLRYRAAELRVKAVELEEDEAELEPEN